MAVGWLLTLAGPGSGCRVGAGERAAAACHASSLVTARQFSELRVW